VLLIGIILTIILRLKTRVLKVLTGFV